MMENKNDSGLGALLLSGKKGWIYRQTLFIMFCGLLLIGAIGLLSLFLMFSGNLFSLNSIPISVLILFVFLLSGFMIYRTTLGIKETLRCELKIHENAIVTHQQQILFSEILKSSLDPGIDRRNSNKFTFTLEKDRTERIPMSLWENETEIVKLLKQKLIEKCSESRFKTGGNT
jgi:hypothetical protein